MFSDDTKYLNDFLRDEDKEMKFFSNIFNFAHNITQKHAQMNKIAKSSEKTKIQIEGGIRSKVSYLTIANADVTITNNDLNIHTLLLLQSTLTSNSKLIRTNTLIVDMYMCNEFAKSKKFSISHFGIFSYYPKEYILNITYSNTEWEIKVEDVAQYNVPYSTCDMLEYIGDFSSMYFVVKDKSVKQAKTIHFTAYQLEGRNPESPIRFPDFPTYKKTLESKKSIKRYFFFTQLGDWTGISGIPTVIVTNDKTEGIGANRYSARGIAFICHNRYQYKQVDITRKIDNMRFSYIFAGDIPEFASYIEPNRFTYDSEFCHMYDSEYLFEDTDECLQFFGTLETFISVKEKARYSVDINDIDD